MTAAWDEFTRALAPALPNLPADTELELTLDPTASGMGEAVYAVSVGAVGERAAARLRGQQRDAHARVPAGPDGGR